MFAGPVQGVPGRIVFLMANPNSKIVIDPTAGKQVRKRVPRRMLFQKRANLNGLEVAAADTTFVQGTEKSDTAAGIMLPAIFAVEDDAHECRLRTRDGLADSSQVLYEVIGGGRGVAALILA